MVSPEPDTNVVTLDPKRHRYIIVAVMALEHGATTGGSDCVSEP